MTPKEADERALRRDEYEAAELYTELLEAAAKRFERGRSLRVDVSRTENFTPRAQRLAIDHLAKLGWEVRVGEYGYNYYLSEAQPSTPFWRRLLGL